MKDTILFIVESIYSDRDAHNDPITIENCIGGVMVSMLVSRIVDSSPNQVKPKTIKLVFVDSPLSTQR